LIVWDEQDRFISPIYAEVYRKKFANGEVVTISENGHLTGLESPELLAEALLRRGYEQQ